VVTGGIVTTALGFRLSAHSPVVAFVAAAVCAGAWIAIRVQRRTLPADLQRLEGACARRWRSALAVIAVGAMVAASLFHTFSATGADASGYLSYADTLAAGELERFEPLAAIAQWNDGPATLAPLGWQRAQADSGYQVPTYAIGLPLLLAPPLALGGDRAASLMIPVTFALAVLLTGAIAKRSGGASAAIMAAVWLATSPVALIQSMQVMSDVPATAAWLACWWWAYTNRPLPAGLAAAMAALIRPNLAPLAILPAIYLARNASGAASRAAAIRFAIPALVAGSVVAYLQWRYFGSPLRSGYGTAAELYDLTNLASNAGLYGRWLIDTHGPWLLFAPAAAIAGGRELRWGLAFAVVVVFPYLLYAVFESWTYLRFMLPALVFAMIATSTLAAMVLGRMPVAIRVFATTALVLALATVNLVSSRTHGVFRLTERQARGRIVGQQLAAFLPVNAVIVSGEHSGTVRYYTDRTVLRWDLIAADAMAEALDRLSLNGYQVWVVLDDWEEESFRRKFPALAAASLDYEPAVESAAGVGIRTRAWRARRNVAASSNSEYATGTTTSVRNSESDWPPMTTTAIVRRSSAPGPVPSASGSMPPTSASVVMRIGRSRSRFASMIATPRS
jgi:hypothetical protein